MDIAHHIKIKGNSSPLVVSADISTAKEVLASAAAQGTFTITD